jgi:hypothetical protein
LREANPPKIEDDNLNDIPFWFTGESKRLGPDSNAVIDQLAEMQRQSAILHPKLR